MRHIGHSAHAWPMASPVLEANGEPMDGGSFGNRWGRALRKLSSGSRVSSNATGKLRRRDRLLDLAQLEAPDLYHEIEERPTSTAQRGRWGDGGRPSPATRVAVRQGDAMAITKAGAQHGQRAVVVDDKWSSDRIKVRMMTSPAAGEIKAYLAEEMRAAAEEASTRVRFLRFTPLATRDAAAQCVQVGAFVVWDARGAAIAVESANNPGGRTPAGHGPQVAVAGHMVICDACMAATVERLYRPLPIRSFRTFPRCWVVFAVPRALRLAQALPQC